MRHPGAGEEREHGPAERVAGEEGEDAGQQLEREDEGDEQQADLLALRRGDPSVVERREQEHPHREAHDPEWKRAAHRSDEDAHRRRGVA